MSHPVLPLTASQREALASLRALSEIYFERTRINGVLPRTTSLVVGPSGVGKTFVVTQLGTLLRLPVLKLTVGDWIPSGARNEPCTLALLRSWLDTRPRFLLHLDELDKLRAHDNAWSFGVLTEVFSVLDRKVAYAGTKNEPWTAQHTQALRDNVFMVGSGTWQDLWPQRSRRTIGFLPAATAPAGAGANSAIVERIREARVIPEELLYRFCGHWSILSPYTREDFELLGRALQLPAGVLDPTAAAASGQNYRYLEAALTAHALQLYEA